MQTSRTLTRYTAQEAKPEEENAERPTLNVQRPMKKKLAEGVGLSKAALWLQF
jgi:hypothetical protein